MKHTILLLLLFLFTIKANAQTAPGFIDEEVHNFGWNVPVGLTFDANSNLYVWEKAGKVFKVEGGVRYELIDLQEEVLNYLDHGLNGFALDPDFTTNGYIYLYYVVDRKYLFNLNIPDDQMDATIARITRYTVNTNDFRSVDLNSRLILVGEDRYTGIPIVMDNHGVGSLVFGKDGSLMASIGEVAVANNSVNTEITSSTAFPYATTAVNDGIMTINERVGPYRAQVLTAMNGKILRIDPANGNGIPSNPFFEIANNRSAKSRVWAYGLRNPFRFSVKPNTGNTDINAGNPGTLYIGDVGWTHREEINVATSGGMNFGWPSYEGMDYENTQYQSPTYLPVNPVKPAVQYRGNFAQGIVDGEPYDVGTPEFTGENFTGGSSIGGIWYDKTAYPIAYQNTYFHADYIPGWIKSFKFDANNNPTAVLPILENTNPTCLAINPSDGFIYYTSIFYPNINQIRRIRYDANANLKPIAVGTVDVNYGNDPLTVNFSAAGSSDPENGTLSYLWEFGDLGSSTDMNVSHTYFGSSTDIIIATLTVTDDAMNTDTKQIKIYFNNTPPIINSVSINPISSFPNQSTKLYLSADATDAQDAETTLLYEWSTILVHHTHTHYQSYSFDKNTTTTLTEVPCDEPHHYKITLKVTDSKGLSSQYVKEIYPFCNSADIVAPEIPVLNASAVTETSADINWSFVNDNSGGSGIMGYELFKDDVSLGVFNPTINTFKVYGLSHTQIYKFSIIAIDNAGNKSSSPSLFIEAKPPCSNNSVYASSLSIESSIAQFGTIYTNLAVNYSPIFMNGISYQKGIGVHAYTEIVYIVPSNAKYFVADLGQNDPESVISCGSVTFKVFADDQELYSSPIMKANSESQHIKIDIANKNSIKLMVENAGDNDFCDQAVWANAIFSMCETTDIEAPTYPSSLIWTANSSNSGDLQWNASTDNAGIANYAVYMDNVLIGTTSNLNYSFTNLSLINHVFYVQATDVNNNASVSSPITVIIEGTNPCPNTKILNSNNNISNLTTTYQASELVTASNLIFQSNVIYRAAKVIELLPGFSITNSTFVAKIEGCQ